MKTWVLLDKFHFDAHFAYSVQAHRLFAVHLIPFEWAVLQFLPGTGDDAFEVVANGNAVYLLVSERDGNFLGLKLFIQGFVGDGADFSSLPQGICK